MAVRIIDGDELVALYCSTAMEAFGPVFYSIEEAEDFLDWLALDARRFSPQELLAHHSAWHDLTHDAAGDYVGREPEPREPTDEEVTRRGPHIMDTRSENDRSL